LNKGRSKRKYHHKSIKLIVSWCWWQSLGVSAGANQSCLSVFSDRYAHLFKLCERPPDTRKPVNVIPNQLSAPADITIVLWVIT